MPKAKYNRFYDFERTLGRIFLVLISVVAALFLGEWIYRSLRSTIYRPSEIGAATDAIFDRKPYVMYSGRPGRKLNELGYRGPLPNRKKEVGEKRIFLIGGSALVQGHNAIDDFLQSKFKEGRDPKVRVYNFGIAASVTRQDLMRILVDIAGYEPDLIVSFSGYNDLFDTAPDPRINYPNRYILDELNPALVANVGDYDWLSFAMLGSQIMRDYFPGFIFGRFKRKILSGFPLRESFRERIVSAYVQNLRLSRAVSGSLGAKFLAFLQPTVYFKKPEGAGEKMWVTPERVAQAKRIQNLVSSEISKFKDELEFHDLSDLFKDDNGEIFLDFCHYVGDHAIKRIADHLFPIINRALNSALSKPLVLKNLASEEYFRL